MDVVLVLGVYRLLLLSFSLSAAAVRAYVLDGASYRDLVVGDEASSRELRRGSEAALSRRIPARVEEEIGVGSTGFGIVTAGLVAGTVGLVFDASSSVSDSSSELDSSSDDSVSSFLTTTGVAGV